MYQDPKTNFGSWTPRIQDPESWRIMDPIFSFSLGIPGILDHVLAALSWDPRGLGTQTGKMLVNPVDPWSCAGKVSWDPVDIGSWTTATYIMPRILKILYIQRNFVSGFPNSLRCLKSSTYKNFNFILIEPFHVDFYFWLFLLDRSPLGWVRPMQGSGI